MKKGLLYILLLTCMVGALPSCMKSTNTLSITPSMNATIGGYTFIASSVIPTTIKPQLNDTATALVVTGYDPTTGYKIILSVTKYKGKDGTFSIVQGQAAGTYVHGGVVDVATGGIVAINTVSNVVSGYFSFSTANNSITNGTFTVGNPWVY